jgi:ubiquinone/menaquinone biosynthesis C-methylase UbiE
MNSRKSRRSAWDDLYRTKGSVWAGKAIPSPRVESGSIVLELGCGNGKTLQCLLAFGARVVALDCSIEAIRLSRRSIQRPGSEPDLMVADACSLPFCADAFDAVFAYHVVGHGPEEDRRKIAEEISRVLRPGGRLYFREFGQNDMRAGSGAEVESMSRNRAGVLTHYFAPSEVEALFCMMHLVTISPERWKMRIMGCDHIREEITAVLEK